MRQRILQLRKRIKEEKPLIHCITNPISIHDCANVVLAVGARPIMAEHPAEVTDITASAGALMLNLGNITDARIESMKRSMRTAMENKIPVLLDLVGVACSDLRLDLARELLSIGHPAVLKGNMSELLAVSGLPSHAIGIDAGAQDALTAENMETVSEVLRAFQGVIRQLCWLPGNRILLRMVNGLFWYKMAVRRCPGSQEPAVWSVH